MRIRSLAVVVATAAQVGASENSFPVRAIIGERDVLRTPYSDIIAEATMLVRRQDGTSKASEAVQLNPNGTLNMPTWDATTDAACVKALTQINQSTNPSGNCVCYNLPVLDDSTGVFEADLRLYRVSAPRDAFASVKQEDVRVSVEYNGASVSTLSGNGTSASKSAGKRAAGLSIRADTSNPKLLQTYMFVGQVDKSRLKENMSM